jgi:hypothetical protein
MESETPQTNSLRARAGLALQSLSERVLDPERLKQTGAKAARLLSAMEVFAPAPIAKQIGRARGALDALLGLGAHSTTVIDAEPEKNS